MAKQNRNQTVLKWLIISLVILGPCLVTFGGKLQMLIAVFRGQAEWAFAVTPVINYILASIGFVLLFLWAILNGMFSHLEEPKLTMLINERMLDRLEDEQATTLDDN
jgi:nitrogen fixation-related uncharacterized protein